MPSLRLLVLSETGHLPDVVANRLRTRSRVAIDEAQVGQLPL